MPHPRQRKYHPKPVEDPPAAEVDSALMEQAEETALAETIGTADKGLETEQALGHMQLVLKEGLWVGDVYSAQDEKALKEAGITAVVSLITPELKTIPAGIKSLKIDIEDSPSTDILSHMDECVDWIDAVLRSERDLNSSSSIGAGVQEGSKQVEENSDGQTQVKRNGGVLVHCQAGMSRSATIVAAYLMKTLKLSVDEALDMIRAVRPVIEPSQTFREQLEVYHYAGCRVSQKDKETRRWYLERTANDVLTEGSFDPESTDRMAKFPATPTPSQPATPPGGFGRRKIRCKMCRRHLATREHMMDHILDQSPAPRSRQPSMSLHLPSPLSTLDDSPLDSAVANGDVKARANRPPSFSSMTSPSVSSPLNRSTFPHDNDISEAESVPKPARRILDPASIAASLPPQLAALRAGLPGKASPPSGPANGVRRITIPGAKPVESPPRSNGSSPSHSFSYGSSTATEDAAPQNRNQAAKALSRMALTPSDSHSRKSSLGGVVDESAIASDGEQAASPLDPISMATRRRTGSSSSNVAGIRDGALLSHDSKCSGYFVEPLTWMEPMLENGSMAGKILCPNDKCKAKIGNYDWAGVQCGCKEWVIPGFCIARNKVDEVW